MNILAAIVSIIIFIGGLFLFGYAQEFPGYELIVFSAGLIAIAVAVAIPVHLLKRIDG